MTSGTDARRVYRRLPCVDPLFGDRTQKQRAHRDDISSYGVIKGTREGPLRDDAVRHRRPSRRPKSAVRHLIEAVRPAAKLYALLIGVHPFVDGNGRAGFRVLAHGLIRCGAVVVALPEDEAKAFHWCLGQGMRKDRAPDYDPLAEWIVERIIASAR